MRKHRPYTPQPRLQGPTPLTPHTLIQSYTLSPPTPSLQVCSGHHRQPQSPAPWDEKAPPLHPTAPITRTHTLNPSHPHTIIHSVPAHPLPASVQWPSP